MKQREIIERLRREAEEHVPDVSVDLAAARRFPASEGADVIPRRRHVPVVAAAAACFALLLLLAVLLPLLFAGRGDISTLVISINPSAELTLEDGKVTKTRPLNRDAALLLADSDLSGMTAQEACLTFAQLAGERNLIGADGIRIRVTGKDGDKLAGEIHSALDALFVVSDLDDETFRSLFDGYDEDAMERFEDYVTREYGEKQKEYLERAKGLLATYRQDLGGVDFSDAEAVRQFNRKYLLLGEDLLIEEDDDDSAEEIREELIEELEKVERLMERDPQKAFEELFKGFMELVEEEYEEDDD